MDIYLDIDGTIKGTAAPMEDVVKLLEYCLDHCDVYWLTTHCRHGENRTCEALDFLPAHLRRRACLEIGETDWDVLKTDAIDFRNRFVWLDDTILQAELDVLAAHNADTGFFRIEPQNPHCLEDALGYIRAFTDMEVHQKSGFHTDN